MHTDAHTQTSLGKYGQMKVGKHLLHLCNFIRGELVPETGWGVPRKRDGERETVWRKIITAAAKADKQSCSLPRDVDMSVYSADGPTSSDCRAQPKLAWETHKLISVHCVCWASNPRVSITDLSLQIWLYFKLRRSRRGALFRQRGIRRSVLERRGLRERGRGLCFYQHLNLCAQGCGRPLLVKAVWLQSVNLRDLL